jgi:hypothetical protein
VIPIRPFAPVQKSEWEKLLEKWQLADDEEAVSEINSGGVAGAVLRAWIKHEAYRKFVPQKALEAVGLTVSVDLRFPIK